MAAREPAIARSAARWLEQQNLEVYSEVQVQQQGRIADLVGAGSEALVVVETKTSLGLDLIEQAEHWSRFCNCSWCAFSEVRCVRPHRTHTPRTQRLALSICRWLGVGVLAIPEDDGDAPRVLVPARIRDIHPLHDLLRDALVPQRRIGAGYAEPGSKGGGHFTKFRGTAAIISEVVAEHTNGIDVRELEEEVKRRGGHHYSNSKSFCTHTVKLAKLGKLPGVRVSKSSKSFGRKPTVLTPCLDGDDK